MPKRPALLLLVAALTAGALTVPTPAQAVATSVGLVGTAQPATASAPARVTYTVTVTGRVDDVQIETAVFPSAPVDVASIRVDGVTAPSGTVSRTGSRLTVRIGMGADAVNGGTIRTGTVVVSYLQRPPTDGNRYPATSGTLRFTDAGTPSTASSGTVPLTHPDLVVTAPGESDVQPLGTGRSLSFVAQIAAPGAGAAATTVTIELPTGLRIDPAVGVLRYTGGVDGGTALQCTGTSTVACAFGAIPHAGRALVIVALRPTAHAVPGRSATFRVRVTPTGEPDQAPADNAVSGRVRYTGVAVLHYALTPATTRVKVGRTVRITLRITNAGPQPASVTIGLAVVEPLHFTIAGYSTRHRGPGPDMFRVPIGGRFGGAVVWNAGTVRAHRTVTAHLTLRAADVGATRVVFYGQSDAANPACDAQRATCDQLHRVTLHAVA